MISKNSIYIKNIYYMLSYAFQDLPSIEKDKLDFESFENIWELFAKILSNGMLNLAKRGLHREYIEVDEEIVGVKGKLNFKDSIKFFAQNNLKTICTIDEYTENILFNQIIKSAGHILFKSSKVKVSKPNLKKALFAFSTVDIIDLKYIEWDRLRFNKLNNHYRLILNICQMIYSSQIISEEKGGKELPSFIPDKHLEILYERFLYEYYKYHYHALGLGVVKQTKIDWDVPLGSDTSKLPQMRADVVLNYKGKVLIIDAKYYTKIMAGFDKEEFYKSSDKIRSMHLYQIFSYVRNYDKDRSGNVSGMLLYAQTGDDSLQLSEKLLPYTIDGNDIYVNSLDLNRDFDEIKKQLDLIIRILLDFPYCEN